MRQRGLLPGTAEAAVADRRQMEAITAELLGPESQAKDITGAWVIPTERPILTAAAAVVLERQAEASRRAVPRLAAAA